MVMIEERRRHERVPVDARLHCRRLGLRGFDEDVQACDLSLGGAHLLADGRLSVGDVVALDVDIEDISVQLRGLVVGVRPIAEGGTRRHVHVAFTGLSPERLARLGDLVAAGATPSSQG